MQGSAGCAIAHLAGSWFSDVASTFVVGGPQIPKDRGFGGFSPIPVLLVPSVWAKTAAAAGTHRSSVARYAAGFLLALVLAYVG